LDRITPAAIVSAELVVEPPGLLGSSEQTTTGARWGRDPTSSDEELAPCHSSDTS
jgi:hypothetical protein